MARLAVRAEQSAQLFADLNGWMEQTLPRISGKSDLAVAIRYALSRWDALSLVLRDGCVCLDNNAAERAMRPIPLGRKNWMFAGSDAGGERAAAIYSLTETALCRARHSDERFSLSDERFSLAARHAGLAFGHQLWEPRR